VTPVCASLTRAAAHDSPAASRTTPARIADLAVCALLAVVTVSLLVSAI